MWRMRCMLKLNLVWLLLDLLKLVLKKVVYYVPLLLFKHSEDDHDQLEGNFVAATTSEDPNRWHWRQVPVVPAVVELLIDAESIKKQLAVVQYRDLILKRRSRRRQSEDEDVPMLSSCIVCMSITKDRDEVRELCNCEHVFHRGCLDAWIGQSQSTCPLCRSELLGPASSITATTPKLDDEEGGRDPWRAKRMIYLFGEDFSFTS
ncbi:hypothetical protein M0R45_038362 [Rubus argutus]|uniref:RING-type domain-containing protein n=2 Tax=Rubus argutus TaxID=59490 RepID=A0AAW1W545_RUBAR